MNCENQSARAVDLGTTLRVGPRVHSPSSNNRPERNENCVTHVVGLKCYLCRRLLRSPASSGGEPDEGSASADTDPSSALPSARHLLPQGEKGSGYVRV